MSGRGLILMGCLFLMSVPIAANADTLSNAPVLVGSQQAAAPQQSELLWASLNSTGAPTGQFTSISNLITNSDTVARYILHVGVSVSSQLAPGNVFSGTFPDIDPAHLPPNHPFVHWPGTTAGSLDGDYRLESTFQGTITHLNNGNPFPINANFGVNPDPNASFD